jgi:phosphoribosyl-dephospho-CoA transferase
MEVTPHDLLRISDGRDLVYLTDAPDWVAVSLERAPYVVVRRILSSREMVPVGVRGPERHQRFGGYLSYDSVQDRIQPELLSQEQRWLGNRRSVGIPALEALPSVKRIMDYYALDWGPTGSVGFELASQMSTATYSSDLDLIIRAPGRISRDLMCSVHAALSRFSCRIDVQIETPYGAVLGAEWVNGVGSLLRKQVTGPVLVGDPWAPDRQKSSVTRSGAASAS